MGIINWVAFGGILIDIIVICAIIWNSFWGYKKGLVNVIFKILAFFVALIVVLILYKPVSNFIIENTSIDDKISNAIYTSLMKTTVADGELLKPTASNNMSTQVVKVINSFVSEAIKQAKSDAAQYAAIQLSYMIIRLGTIISLFVITRCLLIMVSFVAELIVKLPIIRMFNRSGGLIYGVVKGFLIVYLLFGILSIISPLISDAGIIKAIQDSTIGSRMYNNNFILKLIFK